MGDMDWLFPKEFSSIRGGVLPRGGDLKRDRPPGQDGDQQRGEDGRDRPHVRRHAGQGLRDRQE